MRVTTKMLNNNMMANISKNKSRLNTLNEQYTTGQKIQRPSDDPIIAVRTLKLRQTMTEINQYVEKNIPDAMSWMDITTSALDSMDSIMTSMYGYLNQGATDVLATSERKTVAENLEQLKGQLYSEGNANYSGRYVFTGYKTDTPLTFQNKEINLDYRIKENFDLTAVDEVSKVIGFYNLDDYDAETANADVVAGKFNNTPVETIVNKIQLGYNNLKAGIDMDPNNKITAWEPNMVPDASGGLTQIGMKTVDDSDIAKLDLYVPNIEVNITGKDGTIKSLQEMGITLVQKSVNDRDAYDLDKISSALQSAKDKRYQFGTVASHGNTLNDPQKVAIFIPETGEIILSNDAHNTLRINEAKIEVEYSKDVFEAGDVRPEHYYTCTSTDKDTNKPIIYTYEKQNIDYEINFGQKMTVNTNISDVVGNNFARTIDNVLAIVNEVNDLEKQISDADKFLASQDISKDQKEALTALKTQLETQLTIKNKMMTNSFEEALDKMKGYQSKVNTANANLGSRYSRLEMVEQRLTSQYSEYEELLSDNIDVDLVETYVNLTSANSVYESSLSTSAKIAKNSLLDFI